MATHRERVRERVRSRVLSTSTFNFRLLARLFTRVHLCLPASATGILLRSSRNESLSVPFAHLRPADSLPFTSAYGGQARHFSAARKRDANALARATRITLNAYITEPRQTTAHAQPDNALICRSFASASPRAARAHLRSPLLAASRRSKVQALSRVRATTRRADWAFVVSLPFRDKTDPRASAGGQKGCRITYRT